MSMPELKLVSHKLCPYVQRARIVLNEKAVPHQLEFIDLGRKPDWFLAISPLGKVPVLLVDGEPLFESGVIAEYLDEISDGSMLPAEPFARARSRAWIEVASALLGNVASLYNAADDRQMGDALATLEQRFRTLEAQLGAGPYFDGEVFSLVDAAFAPLFRYFDVIEPLTGLRLFVTLPKLQAWRQALRARPSVQQAVIADYYTLLEQFLKDRNSRLAELVRTRRVA